MTLFVVVLFSLAIGVVLGISIAPTVYEMHGEYILARFKEKDE